MTSPASRPIALVGLMGAGKSAVARILGERFAVPVADLDAMLEAEEGRSIARIFEHEGEAYFRARESVLLGLALEAGARILACGGGVVLDPSHRELLHTKCEVVWLEVSPAEAARRVGDAAAERPMLRGGVPLERLAALLAERGPLYAEVAHHRVPTDGKSAAEVADAVAAAVGIPA